MTPTTLLRLLTVALAFDAPFSAAEFAAREYSDSPRWNKRTRRRGAQPGGFVVRSVGGVLSRLVTRGFLAKTARRRYSGTQKGREYFSHGGTPVEDTPTVIEQPNVALPPAPQWVTSAHSPTGWVWWDGCCGHWMPDAFGNLAYYMPLAS